MQTIRYFLPLITLFALIAILGCSHPDTANLQTFLDKISHAAESELPGLLYGYDQLSPEAQQVVVGLLQPLRSPSADQHMTVEAVRRSGRFTLIVARVPWALGSEPSGFHPIIITGDSGQEKVVGYILPFDDVIPLMKGEDLQRVAELSQWWIQEYAQRPGL